MLANHPEIITVSVQDFLRISGLGLTTCYALLGSGDLESCNVGRRRLIIVGSWYRYLEAHRTPSPGDAPLGSPPRPARRPAAA